MASRSKMRGHDIAWDQSAGIWRYTDGTPTVGSQRERQCGYCDKPRTSEGHDGCLGTLSGVRNACCGHGETEEAYVQFSDGSELRGQPAVDYFSEAKSR